MAFPTCVIKYDYIGMFIDQQRTVITKNKNHYGATSGTGRVENQYVLVVFFCENGSELINTYKCL